MGRTAYGLVAALMATSLGFVPSGFVLSAHADARRNACKAAMNDRIQVCTNDCTGRALAAVPLYKDTNNNVKFGCLKGCAIGQIMQMRACVAGKDSPSGDATETNRH